MGVEATSSTENLPNSLLKLREIMIDSNVVQVLFVNIQENQVNPQKKIQNGSAQKTRYQFSVFIVMLIARDNHIIYLVIINIHILICLFCRLWIYLIINLNNIYICVFLMSTSNNTLLFVDDE